MFVKNDIPFKLTIPKIMKILRLAGKADGDSTARRLLEKVSPLTHPRVAFDMAFIDGKGKDNVRIQGNVFSSLVLKKNLEEVERVFPYVITIGGDLETEAGVSGDLLEQYYLETIADLTLDSLKSGLETFIKSKYGLEKLSSMSPGSLEEWPITEQAPLFDLLGDVEERIGVRLTDSFLMLPRKSVSGLLFPSKVTFFSCLLCPREQCPGRKAPYNGSLKKEYGLSRE